MTSGGEGVRFTATIDVRTLQRFRLMVIELEALELRMAARWGEGYDLTTELRNVRRRFLTDVDDDRAA